MAGVGSDFSQVLNLTLRDVEEQLGATEAQLRTMDMEEVLKQLYNSTTLDTLPSFMRAPSWQQQQQPGSTEKVGDGGLAAPAQAVQAPPPAAWEAAAAASAVAAREQQRQRQQQQEQQRQQQQAAAAAAAQQAAAAAGPSLLSAQLPHGGMLPLSSVRMDQIFSWYAENAGQGQGQGQGQKAQAPLPSMTLSQLFDTAGLQLATPGTLPHTQLQQGPVVMLPPPQQQPQQQVATHGSLHAQLGMVPPGGVHSLHMHAHASMLPMGLSPAGPFASDSSSMPTLVPPNSMHPPSMHPPNSIHPSSLHAPNSMHPPSMHPSSGLPPRGDAGAAARAARSRKRKDMATPGGSSAPKASIGLSAAEAARQALEVAERAAAELAELPADLPDKETRAIKRAIKNRESAARSRAKRQEYTATLEEQVEKLKQQNTNLRQQVVTTAAAPPDPHAATLDGELLRRSRTGPI